MAHPKAEHFQLLISHLNRGKLLRFTQFFARFYIWTLSYRRVHGAPSNNLDSWHLLRKQTILIRRLSRLGSNIQQFQDAARLLITVSGKSDLIIWGSSVFQKLGLAVYLTCDGLIALEHLELLSLTRRGLQRVRKQASFFWAMSILSDIVSCFHNLQKLQLCLRTSIEKKSHTSQAGASTVKRNMCRLRVAIFSHLCDLVIATASLGIIRSSDGVIGVCGMASTVISTWVSINQPQSVES